MMAVWLAVSLALHVVATHAHWWSLQRQSANERAGWGWRAALAGARGVYFIALPYAALLSGLVTPKQYAIPDDWLQGWPLALRISLGLFLLIALVLFLHRRIVLFSNPPHTFPAVARRAQWSQPWGFAFLLRDTLYLQAHWLFYRTGALGYATDAFNGMLMGLALIGIEWLLDPLWRQQIRTPGQREDHILVCLLCLHNQVLFFYTQNLFLMFVAHAALWLGWVGLLYRWYRTVNVSDDLTT